MEFSQFFLKMAARLREHHRWGVGVADYFQNNNPKLFDIVYAAYKREPTDTPQWKWDQVVIQVAADVHAAHNKR